MITLLLTRLSLLFQTAARQAATASTHLINSSCPTGPILTLLSVLTRLSLLFQTAARQAATASTHLINSSNMSNRPILTLLSVLTRLSLLFQTAARQAATASTHVGRVDEMSGSCGSLSSCSLKQAMITLLIHSVELTLVLLDMLTLLSVLWQPV